MGNNAMQLNEWREVAEAVADGTVCHVQVRGRGICYQLEGEFFKHDDGFWYRIDPAAKLDFPVTHFRPVLERRLHS